MNTHRWSKARSLLVVGALALITLLSTAPAALARTETNAACLSVGVVAQADVATHGDGVDTYAVTFTNRGGALIKGVTINVPIAAGYWLADASFDRANTWVTALSPGMATIRVEGLRGENDAVVGTLRFSGPADSATSALTERLMASWSYENSHYSTYSNLPIYGVQRLDVALMDAGTQMVSSDIFAAGEPITFWYTSSAGVSTALVVVDGELALQPAKSDLEEISFRVAQFADADGAVAIPLRLAGVPAGAYTLVAYGNWSGATATAMIYAE